jgi:hypothetical protein
MMGFQIFFSQDPKTRGKHFFNNFVVMNIRVSIYICVTVLVHDVVRASRSLNVMLHLNEKDTLDCRMAYDCCGILGCSHIILYYKARVNSVGFITLRSSSRFTLFGEPSMHYIIQHNN